MSLAEKAAWMFHKECLAVARQVATLYVGGVSFSTVMAYLEATSWAGGPGGLSLERFAACVVQVAREREGGLD